MARKKKKATLTCRTKHSAGLGVYGLTERIKKKEMLIIKIIGQKNNLILLIKQIWCGSVQIANTFICKCYLGML